MPHPALLKRLEGIHRNLLSAYDCGVDSSSASKGSERENFIQQFLEQVLPQTYRFGSGDIIGYTSIDNTLKDFAHVVEYGQSGQVDIVVEYPFFPALKPVSQSGPRLYLAEGVASVVEVKSDLSDQWDEVCDSARKVKSLERDFSEGIIGRMPPKRIPFYAVGYKGWKNVGTLTKKLEGTEIDGALILDPCLYSGTIHGRSGWEIAGYPGLWALLALLIEDMNQLVSYSPVLMNNLLAVDQADIHAAVLQHSHGIQIDARDLRCKSTESIAQLVAQRKKKRKQP